MFCHPMLNVNLAQRFAIPRFVHSYSTLSAKCCSTVCNPNSSSTFCDQTLNVKTAQRFAIQSLSSCIVVALSMSNLPNDLQCKLRVHVLLSGTQYQSCSTIWNTKSMLIHCWITLNVNPAQRFAIQTPRPLGSFGLFCPLPPTLVAEGSGKADLEILALLQGIAIVSGQHPSFPRPLPPPATIYNTNKSSMFCGKTLLVNPAQRFAMQSLCPCIVVRHSLSILRNDLQCKVYVHILP
jgi:hypothetical protein